MVIVRLCCLPRNLPNPWYTSPTAPTITRCTQELVLAARTANYQPSITCSTIYANPHHQGEELMNVLLRPACVLCDVAYVDEMLCETHGTLRLVPGAEHGIGPLVSS